MSAQSWDEPEYEPDLDSIEETEGPRDPVVDLAKKKLREFFNENALTVFYKRQLQVIFEGEFFHWVTDRALTEIAGEGYVASETEVMPVVKHITFFRAKSHRFWKRQATEIRRLVGRFSDPAFTAALGAHGEQMFDAALPAFGFMPRDRKVRSYGGRTWTETGHDLDRVYERDGVVYGVEIKNTLKYIPRDEFVTKLRMCGYLGLRPLFIVRFAPKSYNFEVYQQRGFTLIFKYQLYPHGYKALAEEVQTSLRLPVDSPSRISDGTIQRFLTWHLLEVEKERQQNATDEGETM